MYEANTQISADAGQRSLADPPALPFRAQHLARIVLFLFLLTFICARILVYLIMARRMPDLFFHAGQTHVHHLNYGIFLLSGVGAWLLFARPAGRGLNWAAAVYGLALGLTFDEFGMWLHLGGGYWQRASYDAIVVIAALLGLIAVGPSIRRWRLAHTFGGVVLLMALAALTATMVDGLSRVERRTQPELMRLEDQGPQ